MAEYAMALKKGMDLIHKTTQNTHQQAVQYFTEIKQMPIEEFNKIFIVVEINKTKNETH